MFTKLDSFVSDERNLSRKKQNTEGSESGLVGKKHTPKLVEQVWKPKRTKRSFVLGMDI
jgi:hypothetical protein